MVVVVTQAVPFQYCPLGQVVVVVEVTQEVPFQYCPDAQVVVVGGEVVVEPGHV